MLRLVLKGAPEDFEDSCLGIKDLSSSEEDNTHLYHTLCLLSPACFWGLEDEIRGSCLL